MPGTVLIVDDSPTVRTHAHDVLAANDVFDTFLEAADGAEGFKMLAAHDVDLVLCDVVMPGLDGFKFLSLKNQRRELDDVPVILLTSKDDIAAKVRGFEAGASDYVTKPVQDLELVARVRVHLKVKLLQDQLREKNLHLQQISRTDPLTQLANRRYFMERFAIELSRSQRYQTPLSYVMGDIDLFKQVNDRYGHQAGDQALVHVARVIQEAVRSHDMVCRYGGEEIGVLLPQTNAEYARTAAERWRQLIEKTPVQWEGHAIQLTLSFGVASFPLDEAGDALDSVADLIKRADDALYIAKANGRNRVVLA